MDEQLKKLAQSARDFRRPGHVCQVAARVLVPLWRIKADVWAVADAGPQKLDKIFFGLLNNGITSRGEIAARLGVDDDEFVLSHLDELARAGYVADNGDAYALTPEGAGFLRGDIKEERMEKAPFSFVWGDMSRRVEPESVVAGKSATGHKLKHGDYPADDNMVSVLAECFNQDEESRERGLVFYDVAYPAASRRSINVKPNYAEHIALFYAPAQGSGDMITGLRVYDKNEEFHFRLCKELSDSANKEEHWREQFAKIYEKETAAAAPPPGGAGGDKSR